VYGEFYGGSDAAAAALKGLISRDRGRTWGDLHTVQPNVGGRNVMSVSLLRLGNREILLAFLRKDRPGEQCTPFVSRSADEGCTWSAPEPVTPVTRLYHVVNNDRLVQLRNGRVLMPATVYNPGFVVRGVRLFASDDGGHTWRASGIHPFFPQSKTGPQEPGLIELRDGRLMMWCRSDQKEIFRCFSSDGGETFGPWAGTGLKAPVSPASIKRLPSTGDLLCLFNNHQIAPDYWCVDRAPLTAAVSADEGATWRVAGDLEPDRTRSYCYTSITFLPEGEILLTYYHGRCVDGVENGRFIRSQRNLAHLKVGIFKEDWLYGR
jgi:hypothetical protein